MHGDLNAPSKAFGTAVTSKAGKHKHTVDIAEFTSAKFGKEEVNVTMPYIQLRYCRKVIKLGII